MRKYLTVQNAIYAACVLYIIVSVLVFTCSTSYSILAGDDLGIRQTQEQRSFPELIRLAFDNMYYAYHAWQGTFFMAFLTALLHPMNGLGMPQFRVTMFVCSLLFFISLLFLITVLGRFFRIEKKSRLIPFAALFLFAFLNLNPDSYSEVFFNLTATACYSIPLTLSFLSLAFMLKMLETQKKHCLVIACVTAVCVTGCSLMTVGVLCYLLLLMTVYAYLQKSAAFRGCLAVFLFSFAGALVNVLAPGNYERQQTISGTSPDVFSALVSSVKYAFLEAETLLSDTPLLAVLTGTLILGILSSGSEDTGQILSNIKKMLPALLTPFVVLFPLELGINSAGLHVRGRLVLDVYLLLALMFPAFFLGQYTKSRITRSGQFTLLLVLLLNAVMALSFNRMTMLSSPQWGMTRNLVSGSYRSYYTQMQTVMYELENSTESDLVLTLPEALTQYYNCDISTDPAYPVNYGLAVVYEKESIRAAK